MSNVPTNLIPSTITQLPEYQGSSTLGYFAYSLEGRSYKVQFANLASVGAVPSTRVIAAGTGLTGGGDLSQDRVISIANGGVGTAQLADSGVIAGSYGSGTDVPVLTVDAKGRITAASTTPLSISGYVPTSRTITTGAGLLGGGSLASNLTLTVDFSSATPQALGSATAGVSTAAARGDHVHPAVNLSDTNQTQGALPLGRGGTGDALSPVAGAVVYSTGTKFALADPGIPGQVFTSDGAGEPYWQTISGTGTVSDVSVVTANGFAGTVANPNTTPEITVSTTVTGLVKGDGTAISAAVAGTDYVAPGAVTTSGLTMAASRLLGRTTGGSGAVEEITVGTGLTLSAGTLSCSVTGTVTSVAASGGATGLSFSGGPITSSGTLTLGGTLAVASGGTGAATAGAARTALGAAASGANTDITSIALTSGTVLNSPVNATDIANKGYVDSISAGINFHQAVRLASAAALPAYTYNNGSSGVGATITANANGALTLDGVAAATNDRVLIKNETSGNAPYNGVYVVTQTGNGSTPFILTRATDYNTAGTSVNQIDAGDFFLVTAGSTQANTSWVQQTPLPIVVGTTALVFTQFAAPITYSAGTGLTLAGTVFSITNTGVTASTYGSASQVPVIAVNAQGQITSASSSSIAIAASQVTSGVLAVANGGTGQSSYTDGQLLIGNSTGNTLTKATLTAGTNISITNGAGAITINATDQYTGTVTSVDVSGGTTGLTTSGGPVTSSGTITLAGTLNVANGGTGATSLTSGYLVKGNGTSAVSASVVYDDGTNVGIGTSSPGARLDVRAANIADGTNGGIVNVYSTTAQAANVGGKLDLGGLYDGSNSLSFASVAGRKENSTSGDWSGYMQFSTRRFGGDFAERMRIDSSGNVGIGTSSPVDKLNVSDGTATFQFKPLGGSSIGYMGMRTNHALGFTTNDTERMRLDTSGNLGLGTSSPGVRLDVAGSIRVTNNSSVQFRNAAGTGVTYFTLQSDDNFVAYNAAGTPIYSFTQVAAPLAAYGANSNYRMVVDAGGSNINWVANGSERMRIDSSGNVGIGVTSISAKLDVLVGSNQRLLFTERGTSGAVIDAVNAANNAYQTLILNGSTVAIQTAGSGTRLTIGSTGAITSSDLADAVGYKGLPQNQRTSGYTLALSDMGKHIYATAGAFTITIPANSTTAFPVGTAITIVVEDAAKTLAPAGGVTLVLAGTGAATTGSRTLAIGSVVTVIKVQTDRWYVSGSGVT